MAYRNPSPPPNASLPFKEDKDQVSETVLSKSWLLSVMVKTVADTKHSLPATKQQPPQPSSDQQAAGEI